MEVADQLETQDQDPQEINISIDYKPRHSAGFLFGETSTFFPFPKVQKFAMIGL